MALGYVGRIALVDLSAGRVSVENPDDRFYRSYMGGRTLAGYYLLRDLRQGCDPLAPDNVLVFATSVLTGVPFPGNARYTVAAKSPLTNGWGESEAGGFFGPELKFAGYDALVIRGAASSPVYLWVGDGRVEVRDASTLWGRLTYETEVELRRLNGDDRLRVACIGPAGERLVRYACVIAGSGHANGRTGMGAVMGSKKLKAVAVRGTGSLKIHDKEAVARHARYFAENSRQPSTNLLFYTYGTAGGVLPNNALGILPTRNFREGVFEAAERLAGEHMVEQGMVVGAEGCWACPVRCKKEVRLDSEDAISANSWYGAPEYETISALGSNCGVGDVAAVVAANRVCAAYGIDTISAGAAVSFAMECSENGLLPPGLEAPGDLRFGNAQAMVSLTRMIAERRGIGDLLAEGVKRASERIGRGSQRFAIHVKGEEVAMQEPRLKAGAALGYAIAPQGGDHIQMEFDFQFEKDTPFLRSLAPLGVLSPVPSTDLGPRKVALFSVIQKVWSAYQALDLCIFIGVPGHTFRVSDLVGLLNAATGWDASAYEFMRIGEKGLTMARLFNVREGFSHQDDWLPERFFHPLPAGPSEGKRIDPAELKRAISLYYEVMGWDDQGVPRASKLAELDLQWAAPAAEAPPR